MFFSCTFSIRFDPKTEKPIPVSSAYLVQQLKVIGRDFGIMCVVMSILAPYGWELFETGHEVNSFDHSLLDMFSWQHLANNLFATSKSIAFLKFMQILYHIILTLHTFMHEY